MVEVASPSQHSAVPIESHPTPYQLVNCPVTAGTPQATQQRTYSTNPVPEICLHAPLCFADSKSTMPALTLAPPLFCPSDPAVTPIELQS